MKILKNIIYSLILTFICCLMINANMTKKESGSLVRKDNNYNRNNEWKK